jgi:hypothetical protein
MTIVLFAFFIYDTKKAFFITLLFISPILIAVANAISGGKLVHFNIPENEKMQEQPIFVLMPLMLNIYVIWKFMATRGLAEKQIQQQKFEIEQKNKDMTDSINYAKRIQQAQMPTEKYIDRSLERLKKKGIPK